MNANGNTIIPIPCAAWALPANSPMVMNSHSKANPNAITRPNAASSVERRAVEAEANRERDRDGHGRGQGEDQRVGDRPRGEHAAPRDRERAQPVDEPLLEVLRRRHRGADAAEQHAGGDEPGHEVVHVGQPGDVDRATEQVAVDQEEHRHLERRHDDQLRRAHVAQERAAGDRRGAPDQAGAT